MKESQQTREPKQAVALLFKSVIVVALMPGLSAATGVPLLELVGWVILFGVFAAAYSGFRVRIKARNDKHASPLEHSTDSGPGSSGWV